MGIIAPAGGITLAFAVGMIVWFILEKPILAGKEPNDIHGRRPGEDVATGP